MTWRSLLFFFLLFLAPHLVFAGIEQISEKEFRELAAEMAPKVNLFQEVWQEDPSAEFYGGTSRDFLYWLKGQFTGADTRESAEAVVTRLKNTNIIDVQSFIIGDSDIDVISAKQLSLNPLDYGVRKIDSQPTDIFQAESEAGFNEIHQGYAPAEKIRLSSKGIIDFPTLGRPMRRDSADTSPTRPRWATAPTKCMQENLRCTLPLPQILPKQNSPRRNSITPHSWPCAISVCSPSTTFAPMAKSILIWKSCYPAWILSRQRR